MLLKLNLTQKAQKNTEEMQVDNFDSNNGQTVDEPSNAESQNDLDAELTPEKKELMELYNIKDRNKVEFIYDSDGEPTGLTILEDDQDDDNNFLSIENEEYGCSQTETGAQLPSYFYDEYSDGSNGYNSVVEDFYE